MAVKAWGPLFALLAILAASLTGMAVQYTHQNNQSKPAKSENGHGSDRKIVAVAAPEPDNAKAKEKHNAEEGFKATDWLLVLFNALLALYTWRLYRATSGLFTETAGLRDAAEKQRIDSLRSIVASETAAKAAQASAESLPILERAYVFLGADAKGVLMRDGRIESGVEVRTMRTTVEFFFKNHGRTPAIFRGMEAVACYVKSGHESSRRDIPLIGGGFPIGVVLSADSLSDTLRRPCVLAVGDYEKASRGEGYILFWGEIRYDDIFGKPRTTGFAREYNFNGGNWVQSPIEELNYFT